MPKSKLQREFQADEDGTVLVPKELLPEPTISLTALKKTVKRPMSEAQKANCERLIAENKKRWAALREAKEKQSPEALSAVKQEEEKLIEQGTHVRLKVREKIAKPRKAKEDVPQVPPPASESKQKPHKKKKHFTSSDDDEDTTETEPDTTEVEDSDEEPLPPRRAVRQARRAVRTLQKIDEVLETATNPYLARLASRWR
jgi:hypothetical protein